MSSKDEDSSDFQNNDSSNDSSNHSSPTDSPLVNETTTEKNNKSLEDQILESAYIGIISYCCLILTTILVSGFFGLPRYLLTPFNPNTNFITYVIETNLHGFLRFLVKLPLFFITAIAAFFGYLGFYFGHIAYAMGTFKLSVSFLDNLHKEPWYLWLHTNALSFLSMIVFTGWCLLLYKSIKQNILIKKIVADDKTTPK